ncbi:MAG TPA: DUF6064 family protein [Ramlibacter sp.]|nr:DUF6064 family protein [Ramlibacter sp.]
MTEWWTYGPSDFLMFSPQAYWRLVARYNAAWWPAQVLAAGAPLALLAALRSRRAWAARAGLVLLAIGWAWLGWAFHWQRYAEIFLAAPWTAAACALQALLLLMAAALPLRGVGRQPATAALLLAALALLYPLLAPFTGHPWEEAEVFGFMPEPTALATLAAVLGFTRLAGPARMLLAILPVLSLALGVATRVLIA